MRRNRWSTGRAIRAGIMGMAVLSHAPAWAVQITQVEARGGGLVMSGGQVSNEPQIDVMSQDRLEYTTVFTKVESADHETGATDGSEGGGSSGGGASGGGACAGGSGCSGNCGNSAHGGPGSAGKGGHTTDTTGGDSGGHEHVEVFDRLSPIHLFLTVANTGSADLDFYRFSATVENNTDRAWDGFLFALKRNEAGLATFSVPATPTATGFTTFTQGGKMLEWSGGTLAPGDFTTFIFGIIFAECTVWNTRSDAVQNANGGYQIMLQQFPLVAKPVPEPGTVVLLGSGLLAVCGSCRRRC